MAAENVRLNFFYLDVNFICVGDQHKSPSTISLLRNV